MNLAASPAPAVVQLDGVSVFYGEVIGLSRLDLRLDRGVTGLIGPNGSGKSTLMRMLTGLIAPVEGRVRVLGGDPFTDASVRARIALVPASESFHRDLSGRANLEIAFLARGHDRAAARSAAARALDLSGLGDAAHRSYGSWSRGMRQRLKLGLALAVDAPLVLLDEPFLGVDPPSRRALRDQIARLGEEGRTVVVSSHVLHEIESLTDHVAVLARGRLLGLGRVEALLHDLRDRHPHRIAVELADPRALGGALLQMAHVREIALTGPDEITFMTVEPTVAYRELTACIARLGLSVRRVRVLDGSLESAFEEITRGGSRLL